ncbi:MAG: RNA polymerase sigma factor [Planctomycetaceae bacterium]
MDMHDSREFLERLEQADPLAISVVLEHFRPSLVRIAGRKLPHWVRGRVDPEDIAQIAERDFVLGVRAGKFHFPELVTVKRLLIKICLDVMHDQIREHRASRRDVARDVPLEPPARELAQHDDPLQLATATDLRENLLRGCSPRDRRIVESRSQGYTISEIALLAKRSERLVNQVLAVVRLRLTD